MIRLPTMKRYIGWAFALLVVAGAIASVAQAQPSPAPTYPTHPTVYNAFHNILALPTSGPVLQTVPGSSTCMVVLNQPSINSTITPQGSENGYTWFALPTIGSGSITTPGLYIGQNPYAFFRPYFGSYVSPGISGYEACADNATSAIAPMLNGVDGVLNSYQQLTAIGHPGCATFDSNGNLLAQGGGLPCGGGGSSFVCDAPHSCVTFQTSPSPSPESTAAGGNSANIAGILQGGTVYTTSGDYDTTAFTMSFCPDSVGGIFDFCWTYPGFSGMNFESDEEGIDVIARGYSFTDTLYGNQSIFSVNVGGQGHQSTGQGFVQYATLDATTTLNTAFTMGEYVTPVIPTSAPSLETGSVGGMDADHLYLDSAWANSLTVNPSPVPSSYVNIGAHSAAINIGCCDSHSLNMVAPNTVTIGNTEASHRVPSTNTSSIVVAGRLDSDTMNSPWGTCTMSSGTTCTISTTTNGGFLYTAAICIATPQGTTPIASACSFTSTGNITVTAASSNSLTWAVLVLGNPN